MESAVTNLETSVKSADNRLDGFTWRLDLFDREIAQAVEADGEHVSVMNLLDSVTQMRKEYEHLKRDIMEVQELERTVRDRLHFKAVQAQQTVTALRAKISSHQQQRPDKR